MPPVEIRRSVRSGDLDQLADGRSLRFIDGVSELGPDPAHRRVSRETAIRTINVIELQQAELGWQAVQK